VASAGYPFVGLTAAVGAGGAALVGAELVGVFVGLTAAVGAGGAALVGAELVGVEEQPANVAFWASIARFKEAPSVASATHT